MDTQQNEQNENDVRNEIRTMALSRLFLAGAAGYSVYIVFQLLGAAVRSSQAPALLDQFLAAGQIDPAAGQAAAGMLGGMMIFVTLAGMVPAIVTAAGIWMVFAAAKRNRLPGQADAGLTMIRVILLLKLAAVLILFVIAELVLLMVADRVHVQEFLNGVESGESQVGVIGLIMALVLVFVVINSVYLLKLNGIIKRMKASLDSGRPDSRVSLFAECFSYLIGAVAAVLAVLSLAGFSVTGFLAYAGFAAAEICFALLLRTYRKRMRKMTGNV